MLKESKLNSAFIGIHDIYEEGDWVTVSGRPFVENSFVRWATGQPNNGVFENNPGVAENCGAVDKNGAIIDVQCDLDNNFFCEISTKNAF